jgi:hypothetical protein
MDELLVRGAGEVGRIVPERVDVMGRKWPLTAWKIANQPLRTRMTPVSDRRKRPSPSAAREMPRSSRLAVTAARSARPRRA